MHSCGYNTYIFQNFFVILNIWVIHTSISGLRFFTNVKISIVHSRIVIRVVLSQENVSLPKTVAIETIARRRITGVHNRHLRSFVDDKNPELCSESQDVYYMAFLKYFPFISLTIYHITKNFWTLTVDLKEINVLRRVTILYTLSHFKIIERFQYEGLIG
jgi:hypothetical protein